MTERESVLFDKGNKKSNNDLYHEIRQAARRKKNLGEDIFGIL